MVGIKESFHGLKSKQYYTGVWQVTDLLVQKDGDEVFFVALPKKMGFTRDMKVPVKAVNGFEINPHAYRADIYKSSGINQALKIVSDYNLLISLLELYGKDDREMVYGLADLCKQNGLIGTYEWNAHTNILFPREDSLTRDLVFFGFTLSEAKTNITQIYGLYLCWQYHDYGELEIVDFLKKKRGKPFNLQTIDIGIEKELQEALLSFGYRRDIFVRNGKVKHINYCDTLFGVSKLQLIELIGADANTSRTVALCDNCHKQFYKTHGNMTLCTKCRTGAAKAKRHRDQVKKEKLNEISQKPRHD